MKKDRLLKTQNQIDVDFEKEMSELYHKLYEESLKHNAKTIGTFLEGREAELVKGYIVEKRKNIRKMYTETMESVVYKNGANYTESQAASMWDRIARRAGEPVLQKADMEKLSEIPIGVAATEKKLTSKDKAMLVLLALGCTGFAFSVAIPSILRYAFGVAAGAAGVAVWQCVSDKRCPFEGFFKGLFAGKPPASPTDAVDRELVREIIDTQMFITVDRLKKWNEGIFALAIQEEPVL